MDNLAALGAERLAAILVEFAGSDAEVKRRLRLELAARTGGDAIAAEIGKRITALRSARSFVDCQKRRDFVRDLDLQRAMIADRVAPSRPDLALDLMWRFLDLAQPVLNRVDDSSGSVGDAFHLACKDLGAIAAKARRDPLGLADRVFTALLANEYGVYDRLVPIMLPALVDAGAAHLKSRLAQALAERSKAGGRDWRADALRRALQDIADGQADVDAYIALVPAAERSRPHTGAEIGRRLLPPAGPPRRLPRWKRRSRSSVLPRRGTTRPCILRSMAAARGRRPTSRRSMRRASRRRRSGCAGRRSRTGFPPRSCAPT